MSDTAPFVPDVIPSVINGVVKAETPVVYKTANPTAKTPTKNFSAHYNGHTLSFRTGISFVPDAGLLAVLVAINAPIV